MGAMTTCAIQGSALTAALLDSLTNVLTVPRLTLGILIKVTDHPLPTLYILASLVGCALPNGRFAHCDSAMPCALG